MSKQIKSYPPVGSPDRLGEIMDRGTGMRRRRRIAGATSAGVMGVACLALVMALGSNIKPTTQNVATASDDASTQEAPDQNTDAAPQTTATVASTPVRDLPFLSFEIDPMIHELHIDVNDDATPTPVDPSIFADTSYEVQQCVLVTLTRTSDGDPFAAEGFACRTITPGDTTPQLQTVFELRPATDVAIGCAAVEERFDDPIEMTTITASTQFATSVSPLDLPAGDYSIRITAVSGSGDGCPGDGSSTTTASDPSSGQVENTGTVTGEFTIG